MMDKYHKCSMRSRLLLAGLLLLAGQQIAAAAPAKWTFFIYMLADNNLEPFALMDLEEIMAAMTEERTGDCSYTACGGSCPSNKVETYKIPAQCGSGTFQRRCCSPQYYPDVLILIDKGAGSIMQSFERRFDLPYADYSLLEEPFTNARLVNALPGGQWQEITRMDEPNMASAPVIRDFLQEGFRQYPPESDGSRKYMAVFWDHGNGWLGYGADGKCSSTAQYTDHVYCSVASLAVLTQGLQSALSTVTNPATNQPMQLDIIGFDACLMSMWEIGSVLSPYAKHLMGSELLEPGTGWDYSSLFYMIKGWAWSGGSASPGPINGVTGYTAKDLAEIIIGGYMETRSPGLTLALLDLNRVETSLDAQLASLATAVVNQMGGAPALAMQLLQQRTLLGQIEGALDNVDLGAFLTRMGTVTTGDLKARVTAALDAYTASVLAFHHDSTLPDGTGMAVYFPTTNSYTLRNSYVPFANTDSADLSGWLAFLQQLYIAINTVSSTPGLQDVAFLESYAVPYWSVNSSTWITHGTLTSLAGLTADLMYGFISPSGRDYIIAGTTVGQIVQYAAVGAWSGKLYGLVQDLTPGDGAVDGLALGYSDEQKQTDADGNLQKLTWQFQVYYAKSCYASTADMTIGMLKYTYDVVNSAELGMQLFVSSGYNKAWSEVSTSAGGVIIPYLGTIDLTGVRPGKGTSFGYSDCLKWGYEGTIKVAAFNATQAVGILGLDATRDLATMLTVKGLSGRVKALYGAFQTANKTQGGCQCAQLWSYKDSSNNTVTVNGECVNPDGAYANAWCRYEPESCTGTPTPVDGQANTDFCEPVTTLSGCKCHANWKLGSTSYYGSCANTGDALGSWCVVDKSTCPSSYRAHSYGATKPMTATVGGFATNLTGLDFDYCQVVTPSGCGCSNAWEYGGQHYSGTCRTGLTGSTAVPGITPTTNWCYVNRNCPKGKHLDGFTYDTCTPEGGRRTEDGTLCQFPASYNGITLYDCITYNHSAPGVATPKPWCFTDVASNAWGYCAPWSCTAALKANCPAGNPADNLPGWAQPACLETLCDTRKDLANVSLCTQDSDSDRTLLTNAYDTLAASTAFGQQPALTAAGSLDAYCNSNFGYQCMDKVLDPQCPGLFRQNNIWMASTDKTQLCDPGCLKALCRLQEQAKTSVTGTPGVAGNISITCADGELTTSIMWSLMRLIDQSCGFPGPINLACNKLLSPPQLCAAETDITALTGDFTDGAALGETYAASTDCTWTINKPQQPYISLNFSRFKTECMYDLVTVKDFDGLIGRFSGEAVPSSVTTDTGLIRLKFTADGSLQKQGFAGQYLASSTPLVDIPVCASGSKLLQVVLRTRAYGSELSWVILKRKIVNYIFTATPSEQNIVMAGGKLPLAVASRVPASIAAGMDTEYKDYRSYYSYACLPTGGYSLLSYDSYGDGWEGGRITLSQIVDATTGCVLLSGGSPVNYNLTNDFSITVDADTSSAACSALTSPDGPYSYVEAGLVLLSEDTKTFTLAKQRKIKEGIASLLDVDSAQVTIQSVANATDADISTGQKSMASRATGAAAAPVDAAMSGSVRKQKQDGSAASAAINAAVDSPPATRRLSSATQEDSVSSSAAQVNAGTIQAMLQQERAQQQQFSGGSSAVTGSRRARELSSLAISIPELVASGALIEPQQQLMQVGQWLSQHQATDSSSDPLLSQTPQATPPAAAAEQTASTVSEAASTTATEEASAEEAAAADVAAAVADAAADVGSSAATSTSADAAAAAVEFPDAAVALDVLARDATEEAEAALTAAAAQQLDGTTSDSRKLQQLLTLSEDGTWNDGAAEPSPSTSDASPAPVVVPTDELNGNSTSAGGFSSSTDASIPGSGSSSSSVPLEYTAPPDNSTGGSNPPSSPSSSPDTNTTTSVDDSSSGGSSNSSAPEPGMLPEVLAEKPLATSAGTAPASGPVVSDLMLQLQANQPNIPLTPIKRLVSRGSRSVVPTVELKLSPSQAFGNTGARTTAASAAGRGAVKTGTALGMAAVPKPGADVASGGPATADIITAAQRDDAAAVLGSPIPADVNSSSPAPSSLESTSAQPEATSPLPDSNTPLVDPDSQVSFVPDHLPRWHGLTQTDAAPVGGSDDSSSLMLADAVRPGRVLTQFATPFVMYNTTSSGFAVPVDAADGPGSLLFWGAPMGAGAAPARIDPDVLADVIASGRVRPQGTTRPRPPSGMFTATPEGPQRRLSSSGSPSDYTTADSSGPRRLPKQHKAAKAKQDPADTSVALPLSWPEQLLAAEAAAHRQQDQHTQRQLLQAAPTKGVTVVVRINGYANDSAARAAEVNLQGIVTNGTLTTRLAEQGWPGVSIGLLYTSTGSVGSWWMRQDMIRIIIIACCLGGVALCAALFAAHIIRKRRRAGAAQVPPSGQQPGRPSVASPMAARMSYAAGQQPTYMSPQQAAAMVAPNGRSASPSASAMLTPAWQAAFAAGGQPMVPSSGSPAYNTQGPYGRGGRASVGPVVGGPGMYPVVAPPVGYPGGPPQQGSFTAQGQQQQVQQPQFQQQQFQQQQQMYQQVPQQMGYAQVHPAPMGPHQGRASVSPYGFAAQPMPGYPVMGPPGPMPQQQWQQQ